MTRITNNRSRSIAVERRFPAPSRRFELHVLSTAIRSLPWLIPHLLRKAIARQLRQGREDADRHGHERVER